MKIVVLSQGPQLYSTRRLVSVARRRGHSVEVLNPLHLSLAIQEGRPVVYRRRRQIAAPDAVIPRIAASITEYGLAVLRHFEAMGAVALNSSDAIERSRDKLRCLQLLSRRGAQMPDSAYSRDGYGAVEALTAQPAPLALPNGWKNGRAGRADGRRADAPLVVKRLKGTQGKGVLLAETPEIARSLLDAFNQVDEHALLQRFVAESAGRDVRVFVVGGQVAACMERQAQTPGEFRSNLHLGGKARPIPLDRAVGRVALRATRALGLSVAGVDVLISRRGPLVLEVNPSPGLEGIEGATGVNVAGRVIEQLETLLAGKRRARVRVRRGRRAGPVRYAG